MIAPVLAPAECFAYELPDSRIAQRPVHPYDAAKMLVINRSSRTLSDNEFRDFPALVRPGDLVVFNNSKVIPARLFGSIGGRESPAELLLLKESGPDRWIALGRPLKKLPPGATVEIGGKLKAVIGDRIGEMEIEVHLQSNEAGTPVRALLQELGSMPVPPYIRGGRGDAEDVVDYQSIFAKLEGSVAAPTASLHFTPEVVAGIRNRGAEVAEVTLHVGAASFLPIWREGQSEVLTPPGRERCALSSSILDAVQAAKARGGRVVAVGTTVVRALETIMRAASAEGVLETDLFITPGFRWQAVDVLVTNFHQPRTTHLLLVEALMGRDLLSQAYAHALGNGYRFLSYGDGMVILP